MTVAVIAILAVAVIATAVGVEHLSSRINGRGAKQS